MGISVLVADDLNLSRLGLAALLERHDGIRVAGSTDSDRDALEFAESHRPDVAIISFEGADENAIALAEKISNIPGCRSVLLATTFSRSAVRRAFAAGIGGMVKRSAPSRQFFEAIHRVHQGERVFDAELTATAPVNEDCPLTLREFTVLEHASRGDTVVEIAARLHLSQGTVRNYLTSMVTKLGARNRLDALRIARDSHWV